VKSNYILCWIAYIILVLFCTIGVFIAIVRFTTGKSILLGILLAIVCIWSIVVNTMKFIDVHLTYKIWKKRQN
jgi:hypothetical protein